MVYATVFDSIAYDSLKNGELGVRQVDSQDLRGLAAAIAARCNLAKDKYTVLGVWLKTAKSGDVLLISRSNVTDPTARDHLAVVLHDARATIQRMVHVVTETTELQDVQLDTENSRTAKSLK